MNARLKTFSLSGITLHALSVITIFLLTLAFAAPMASAQNCTAVSDNFSGSGALNSAKWTVLAPASGGYGPLIQAGGVAKPATSNGQGLALYTGAAFTPDQCVQVTVTSQLQGVTGPAVLMDTTGSGYFWFIHAPSMVYELSKGGGVGGSGVVCPIPAVGDRIQLSYTAATHKLTCSDLTRGTSASWVDYTFTHGNPGILVDRREWAAQDSLGSFSAGSGTTSVGSGTPSSGSSASGSSSGSAPAKPTALSIAVPSPLSAGVSGTAYSQKTSVSGGTAPYIWSVASGTLPTGLALASSTGVIFGTPTAFGASSFTLKVTDSGKPLQTKSASTSITIARAPLRIASSTFASGTTGTAYARSLVAAGGTPSYMWSLKGSLPTGLTLGASTGIISGTPTRAGTFSFTVRVSDNGSPVQSQVASTSITIAAAPAAPTGPGTTWYVRPDGGTRYSANVANGQCDGKADTAYSGVGTNQHCAFNDYRYLYTDATYGNIGWVIAGGDTVVLRGGPWRVGYNGPNSGDGFGGLPGDPFGATSPTIPAGTAQQHTRILGENYGSCNGTNKTQLFGGFGVGVVLPMKGAQYVDVKCIELTRHSQCIKYGSPANPGQCSTSYPLDDYASNGMTVDPNTHDVLLQDMWIHGFISRGIIGPIGANVTCLRCNISYNGMAGWDFDDGNSTPYGVNASWNFLYSQIEWNGCNQEYPITHTFPAISCYSQSSGGYGDGVGTPAGTGTGMSIVVDHSSFNHNTQDGLDLLHMDAGNNTLRITNSTSYSNSGAQFKWGANFQSVLFADNTVLSNCLRMSAPIPGAPASFNANLQDFCRASDAILINFNQGSQTTFLNNTVVSYSPTTFDLNCSQASCSQSMFTFKNNIVIGIDNPTTYAQGGQGGGPGGFYYQNNIGTTVRSNNIFYGVRNITCPTGNNAEFCTSPLLVNQPTWTGEASLDNFNFTLTPGSPAKGAGITTPLVTVDYNGLLRANLPSIGAIEN